jgi:AraC-like DNA-binding protein
MDYAEFAPLPALAPFVRCVWTFDAPAPGPSPVRIVPDGRPELIVHCGDRFAEIARDGTVRNQPRALFAGQVTRPLHLRPLGRAAVIGVRFRPAGARPFLGRSLRETTDLRLSIGRLLGRGATALLYELEAMSGTAARVQRVQEFVAARIDAYGERDPLVEAAVARIEANLGRVDVDELARDAAIGRRQLERRFGDAVGVGPALLASIFRFRGVFDVMERDALRPWTDAALAAGYFDQSHFIREFRRFVGTTPTEFARTAAGLAEALAQPQEDVAIVQAAEPASR